MNDKEGVGKSLFNPNCINVGGDRRLDNREDEGEVWKVAPKEVKGMVFCYSQLVIKNNAYTVEGEDKMGEVTELIK